MDLALLMVSQSKFRVFPTPHSTGCQSASRSPGGRVQRRAGFSLKPLVERVVAEEV